MYFWIITKKIPVKRVYLFLCLGCLVRVALLFVFPNLSDDIYRFYWDGKLALDGINPYAYLPSDLINGDALPVRLNQKIYDELNSQAYYSIYPPVSQLSFCLAAVAGSLNTFSVILKLLFLIAELSCVWIIIKILKQMKLDLSNALVYFLNPLVIIEGVGNLHAEVLMMPFLAVFLYWLYKRQVWKSALAYVLAISTKLTPLILGPLILFYLYKRKDIFKFLVIGFLAFMTMFIPLWLGLNFVNLSDSVDLYFRKFEFNASLYYVFRSVGFWFTGHNQINEIGPTLGIITISVVLALSRYVQANKFETFVACSILSYLTYLLLATTVHPWYLIPLILFSCFVRTWTVLVWSGLITLSYYTYSTTEWTESVLLLIIQYLPVYYLLFYELRNHKKLSIVSS